MPRQSKASRRTRGSWLPRRPPKAPADAWLAPGGGFATPHVPPLPTAHAICRRCGRIMRIVIPSEEVPTLQAFVDRRPDGWLVEGMSFSFTGLCAKCRIARPA